jgi:hypothetical protein
MFSTWAKRIRLWEALRLGAFVGAMILAGPTPAAHGAEAVVGTVKSAQGGAFVRRGTERLPVQQGMRLQLNDSLETAEDGRMGVMLEDGTRIALGPKTELRIDRFVYEPVDGNFGMVLRLGRGVLAYISGRIAQFAAKSITVQTPVGVIGVRGTRFVVSLEGG